MATSSYSVKMLKQFRMLRQVKKAKCVGMAFSPQKTGKATLFPTWGANILLRNSGTPHRIYGPVYRSLEQDDFDKAAVCVMKPGIVWSSWYDSVKKLSPDGFTFTTAINKVPAVVHTSTQTQASKVNKMALHGAIFAVKVVQASIQRSLLFACAPSALAKADAAAGDATR
mmetsp:Transcript_15494/g.23404  ORF Transcript_15494/g.23404 Transcript_15494/m.23404 type:complete len:170 (-) Transcript_15494:63-572(-)